MRSSHLGKLNVFWENRLAGKIFPTNSGGIRFSYSPEWIENACPPISLSLPVVAGPFPPDICTSFFFNFMPEESIRDAIIKRKHINKNDCFSFLKMFGRDCAGALIFSDTDKIEEGQKDQQYSDVTEKISNMLRNREGSTAEDPLIPAMNAGGSLAGAQDKLPVRFHNGKFFLPDEFAPTTHILKPGNVRFPHLVVNEFFCMKLAYFSSFTVPDVEYFELNGIPLYICKRFDRMISNNRITRLHQEDFCQAMGFASTRKYEEAKGISFKNILEILKNFSFKNLDKTIEEIFRISIFNYIIGNTDAHGKNFSILHTTQQPELAPFYDLVSCRIYPELDSKFSMSYGGRFVQERLDRRSFIKHGELFEYSEQYTSSIIATLCHTVEKALPLAQNSCPDFSGEQHQFLDKLINSIRRNIHMLEKIIKSL